MIIIRTYGAKYEVFNLAENTHFYFFLLGNFYTVQEKDVYFKYYFSVQNFDKFSLY